MLGYTAGKGAGGGGDITTQSLNVTENGTYRAPAGKAYTPVNVNVPQTVTEPLSVSANGVYTPEAGKAYGPVSVAVPQTEIEELNVSENGTYTPVSGKAYGPVKVNVPATEPNLQNKTVTITENGSSSVTADSGYDGLSDVQVNVVVPQMDTSATAVESVVLAPYTFFANGERHTGTMQDGEELSF